MLTFLVTFVLMDKEIMKELNLTSIEEMIAEDFGDEGTDSRIEFEAGVDAFILGERLNFAEMFV